MTGNVGAIVLAYFLGAIPMGLVLGKLLKGVDIRDYGSGKIGASNVLRSLGAKATVLVLVFDIGKGVAAIFIAKALGDARYVEALAGIEAMAGHNWSIYIRFSGGRGVSTSLGGLFVMAPIWAAGAIGTGLLVIGLSRYVSVGAIEPWCYENLCRLLEREELIPHQYGDDAKQQEVFAGFREAFLTKTRDEWVELLMPGETCVGPVLAIDEVVKDPHLRHRKMIVDIEEEGGGTRTQVGIMAKLSETPGRIRTPGPEVGQHTPEILSEAYDEHLLLLPAEGGVYVGHHGHG